MASSRSTSTSTARAQNQYEIIRPLVQAPDYLNRQPRRVQPMDEIGTSGLRQFGGFVLDEWLAQLQGRKGAWAYREMMDNDPVVGGVLLAIEMLVRGVRWWVDGNDSRAEFVWECMHDMHHTWDEFISEALSMIGYGYAFHEIVYKKRNGPQKIRWSGAAETEEDSKTPASSEYKDGKIGWRKLPLRAQETTLNWDFDGYSGIRGLNQIDWHGGFHTIPIEKALLFRTKTVRNNPEGRSMLRNAWLPYYSVRNLQAIEAIGAERDLAGIPVATPPEGINLFSNAHTKLLAEVQKMVTSIRRDEYEGIVLPTAGWKIELIRSGGTRQIDTDQIIRRYEQRIASSFLADFILVGQDAIGSYAMVDVKSDLFGVVLGTILDMIADVINRHAIPRLMALNGMSIEHTPRLCHSAPGRFDIEKLGNFFYHMAMAGMPIPWSKEIVGEILAGTGLPASFSGSVETEDNPTGELHRLGDGDLPGREDPELPKPQEQRQLPRGREEGDESDDDEDKADLGKADKEPSGSGDGEDEGVAPILARRARVLTAQLDQEIEHAFRELGEEAATAFMSIAQKADDKERRPSRQEITALIASTLRRMNIRSWINARLGSVLRNHAHRVTTDTSRTLQVAHQLETRVPPETEVQPRKMGLRDIEPQVRQSLRRAISEGYALGEHPSRIAQRIRESVPAGRFTKAGPNYRAGLIARDQTAEMQRQAALAAYKANPNVTAVRLRDGIYGPPRSDERCMARDGEVVPIDEADTIAPYHPLCTLGIEPVVS